MIPPRTLLDPRQEMVILANKRRNQGPIGLGERRNQLVDKRLIGQKQGPGQFTPALISFAARGLNHLGLGVYAGIGFGLFISQPADNLVLLGLQQSQQLAVLS